MSKHWDTPFGPSEVIFKESLQVPETCKENQDSFTSLEEAAEISFDEARALTEDYRDFLAKGLTENRPRPIGPHWFCEYAKNRFIAGAEWQREKMLKDAVEGKIYGYYDGSYELIASWLDMPNNSIYKDGDKVKIIIVKQ